MTLARATCLYNLQPARKHYATRLVAIIKAMSQLLQLRSKIAVRPARATMTKTENNDGNMPAQGS